MPRKIDRTRRSPNIWHWPQVYEQENEAQDADSALWGAMRGAVDWTGADVLDVGCGTGYHLPRFAIEARSVIGAEPHPPLADAAGARLEGCSGVRVVQAGAADLPLPDRSVDVVHARTAYFFGPGCEPGLLEAVRVLRSGGRLLIVDLDFTRTAYGHYSQADKPRYRPAAVEAFFDRLGFSLRRVQSGWRFPDRETMEAVLRIEFTPASADALLAETPGLDLPVGYRVHVHDDPDQLLGLLTWQVWRTTARTRLRRASRSLRRRMLGTGRGPTGPPPRPGRPAADQSVAGESAAGESAAGEPAAGEPAAGEPAAGEPVAGQSVAGQSVAGESVAGESAAGESTTVA